jgi:DNA gyrase inhibitor GyrI
MPGPAPKGCVLRRSEALVVAAAEHSVDAAGVAEAFDRLLRWAEVYHVEQWGPRLGVYRDTTAAEPRRVEGEAWLPIALDLEGMTAGDAGVRVMAVAPEPIAACLHRGYPDEVGSAIEGLFRWVAEQGLVRSQPLHRQVYREAPRGRPSEWVIEIQVPVAPWEDARTPAGPPAPAEEP